MCIKTKKKGVLILYEGLKLKVLEAGKNIGVIVVKAVEDNENFTAEDEGSPNSDVRFRFLEETNSWHLVFEGLGDEKCIKEELPYTLCPM